MAIRIRALAPLILAGLLLAACGTANGSPSPSASATAKTAAPTPSLGPDTESVTVTDTGFGHYYYVVAAVAEITNHAKYHTALGVSVVFTALNGDGSAMNDYASPVFSLPPNVSVPVSALCTDACYGAANVTATVSVGSWEVTSANQPSVTLTGISCPTCGQSGVGSDAITATIVGTHVKNQTVIDLFGVCTTGAGVLDGGGLLQPIWTGQSKSQPVTMNVIATSYPSNCTVVPEIGG